MEAIDSIKKGSHAGISKDEVLSLKYAIDYPKVSLHPFDTKKFKVSYKDAKIN